MHPPCPAKTAMMFPRFPIPPRKPSRTVDLTNFEMVLVQLWTVMSKNA